MTSSILELLITAKNFNKKVSPQKDRNHDMDTIPENWSRPYATGPEKTLIYLFLRRRGTGPIFVRKQFSNKNIQVLV